MVFRSKLTLYIFIHGIFIFQCMDADEGVLVVDHFKDVPNQKWTFDLWAGVLKNRVNPNQVLVVAAHNQESAEHAEPTGQDEQRWICTRM